MAEFTLKELSESDWREYQTVRLASLQESPDSFASTYKRESGFTEDQWRARLRLSPTIRDAVALAAISDQTYIGLVSCVIHSSSSECGHLYQMWVAPEHRGKGIGTALIRQVIAWASNRDITSLVLSVTTTNDDAVALYQSIGFATTGETEPLRKRSKLHSQTMKMNLDLIDSL